MKKSVQLGVVLALSGVLSAPVQAVLAQTNKMAPATTNAPKSKTVYVCAKCKVYFTAAQAQKMKMKDAIGHKLSKSTSIPKGYTDGSKLKMSGHTPKSDTKM